MSQCVQSVNHLMPVLLGVTGWVDNLKKHTEISYFRHMEDPSSPTRLVFEVLTTLSTVARESGFCDPFVRADRTPPAYNTELLYLSR